MYANLVIVLQDTALIRTHVAQALELLIVEKIILVFIFFN